MLKTRNGKETPVISKEPQVDKKEKARQEAEAARARAKQEKEAAKRAKESAARARKEAEALARAKARQEAEAARERAKQAKKADKTAKMAAAWVKKELQADAKRKAKQEAEAARVKAKQEEEAAKKAKIAAAMAKKEADIQAREKALRDAEALKQSRQAAAISRKEADALAREKAKREAEAQKQAQLAAAAAKKEAEAEAKAKVKQEAEAAKQAQQAAALASKEAEAAAREKAKQEAETLKQAQQAAALAKKEAEALAREKAKQEADAIRQSRQAAAMAIREAEAIAREKPSPRPEPVEKPKETATWVKKEAVPKVVRTPFFSGRSIAVMVLGLIIGAGLGLGYWIYNPFGSTSTVTTSPTGPSKIQMIGLPSDVPWTSQVKVQIVNPGSSYVNLRDLASTGQYYAAKASSLPFLQFLNNSLSKDAPQYSHTTDELAQMITAKYDSTSEQPTMIISTTAQTNAEASFLATYIPGVFTKYLISEEGDKQQQQYQDLASKVEQVKVAVVQATDEFNLIKQQSGLTDVNSNPEYVALNAKINALETQLNSQAATLAANIDTVALQTAIDQTTQERDNIIATLATAESHLNTLSLQNTLAGSSSLNSQLVQLNAKASALEMELNTLMVGDANTVGLVTLIAQGYTSNDATYNTAMALIDKTSRSLVDTRQQIAILESQISSSSDLAATQDFQLAQAKVDNLRAQLSTATDKLASLTLQNASGADQPTLQDSFDRTSTALADARTQLAALQSSYSEGSFVSTNLEYQLAQAKVNTLNQQLSSLTAAMTASVANDIDTAGITDSLVAGSPSTPVPVLPEKIRMRNALMIGALVGIALAWCAVNFKWLRKSAFSNSANTTKEEEL
jgi:hypothetical protein